MCGVGGYYGNERDLFTDEIHRILTHIEMRGPDEQHKFTDENSCILHSRLQIVGLGEIGRQPMKSDNARYIISFNGEIYNFRELGHKYDIVSRSDTRVLLELIAKIGLHKTLEHLDGPYALALYDIEEKSLTLARDRYGEKPIYYRFSKNSLLFSSNYLPLINDNDQLNSQAVRSFCALGFERPDLNIINEIKSVKPGEIIKFSLDQLSVRLHQKILIDKKNKIVNKSNNNIVGFFETFESGLRSRLNLDRDFAVLLSGGVDSIFTLSKIVELGFRPVCYTIGNEETDEEVLLATKAAKKFGCEIRFVRLSHDQKQFSDFVNSIDMPLGDPAMFAMWQLCKAVSKDFNVAFTGDGADELFGGYKRYLLANEVIYFARHIISTLPVSKRLKFILRCSSKSEYMSRIYSKSNIHVEIPTQNIGKSLYDVMFDLDNNVLLPNYLLMKSDFSSMSHGLELRSGFLNRSLLKYNRISKPYFALNGFKNKKILRKYLINKHNYTVTPGKRGFFVNYNKLLDRYEDSDFTFDYKECLTRELYMRSFHELNIFEKLSVINIFKLRRITQTLDN